MSLPSQSSRGVSRQSAVHTRRRQVSPVRRALPIVVVLFAFALLWFVILKPKSTKADQASNTENQLETGDAAGAAPAGTRRLASGVPVNPRALPDSGAKADPVKEVERAIQDRSIQTPRDTTQSPTLTRPRAGSSGSLLGTAANEANRAVDPITNPDPIAARPVVSSDPSRIRLQLDTARRLIAENDRVAARALLSQTLRNDSLSESEAEVIRAEITEINKDLVFGPIVAPGDPMCEEYRVQSGDSLSKIASRRELATHWKLIQRVNRISNPSRIRLGQRLKLVRGPFHAVVHKREHRLDLYHGSPDDPDHWIYIRSYRVGLGSNNGTPVGSFVVNGSKIENPGWVNPRDSRERYEPDDPDNPIGEFWIGLDGVGSDASKTGYGLHGTVERESIGQNMSMGCVRLADGDIGEVYELLGMHVSRVEIRP
ncbi:MAG: L,D-transpeptidase family protein [Phycisphaerales bacterium]|nr:L,D-transpeptidase family protein [Phycisphaerales bacterium]